MALRIRSTRDFATGCAFVTFGGLTVALARAYPLGTTARMGPGYFPTALGTLLALIGALVLIKSLASSDSGNVERVHVGVLVRLLLSVAAFAFLLQPLGLVATAVLVVLLAASAGQEFRALESLASAVVLALLSYLLFVKGLNQTMPVSPWFWPWLWR